MSDFLTLDAVSKHFSVRTGVMGAPPARLRAVDQVSLSITKGETLGMVGESGCGKSTLARLVVRLHQPTEGRILFEGTDIWKADVQFMAGFPRKVQMVFQDPFSSLNPRRTIGSTIAEVLAVNGVFSRAERKERVLDILKLVGLSPRHADRYPHEFSGGQRQRVAIARALVLNPDLVVCDEPVSALDVSIQAQILNLLEELQTRLNLTYLFISHDLTVVSHVSDRVAVMYLGRLVELSGAEALYEDPLHPYSAALLEAAPVADPTREVTAAPLSGDVPSPLNPPTGCPFHPRCPEAHRLNGACAETVPEWKEVRPGRWAACLLHA